MNIIREKTTIKDIKDSINEIKNIFIKMTSEDFNINQVNSTILNRHSYAWDLILGNESIIKVTIIVTNKYLHISQIDVSKFIFEMKAPNPRKREFNQTIYANYEGDNLLTFQTSEIKIHGRGIGHFKSRNAMAIKKY
jgi:hypothetical protein